MEEEVQQQTSVYVSSDKAALIASLRAKAKRDREVATGDVKEEIEEGEVVEEKERENLLVIELDLISSDGDDNEEVFEETSTPHRLNQQETIARLQEMIEEKEQAKLRANRPVDVSLLKTKTLAQESLLQRVTDECRELSRQKKTLKRQIEHTWAKELKQTRTHIERLNAMMVTAESRVTQILRRQEEAGAELVTVQQSLVEKLELQEGLRSKLKATKQELDALAHAAPSVQQLERAQWLMNAFVVADRGADSVVRASFGHFWASEARDECARVFRALGEKTQREAADQGRRKEEPSFLEPYRSPLLAFHSYRLFPSFMAVMGEDAVSHVTFSNNIAAGTALCRFELSGVCNDETCPFLHQRDYVLDSSEKLFQDLARYVETDKPQLQLQRKFVSFLEQSGSMKHAVTSVLTRDTLNSLLHTTQRPWKKAKTTDKSKEADAKGSEQEMEEEDVPQEPRVSGKKAVEETGRFFEVERVVLDAAIAELRKHHSNDEERWIRLAGSVDGNEQTRVLKESLECNENSWKLWIMYLEVSGRSKEVSDLQELEMLFQCAVQRLPFCAPIWIMYFDSHAEFATRERLSSRALKEVRDQMTRPWNIVEGQAAMFQLLLYRLQLLLDAEQAVGDLRSEADRWLLCLNPWQVVSLKIVLCSVAFGATKIANVSHRFFEAALYGQREYAILDIPQDADETMLEELCLRLLQDDMDCFAMGFDLASRFAVRINLIRLKLRQGQRSVAMSQLAELMEACPSHPDVHWLASRVLLCDEPVSPLLESRYVFALGRALASVERDAVYESLPCPPLIGEALSDAEQVCWTLCCLLPAFSCATVPVAAQFKQALVTLRVQCGALAMSVFHSAHLGFLSGTSAAAPFELAVASARADLMTVDGFVGQRSRSSVSNDQFFFGEDERSVLFESVVRFALQRLPWKARKRVIEHEFEQSENLLLLAVVLNLASDLSMDSFFTARTVLQRIVAHHPLMWNAWHLLLVCDWIRGDFVTLKSGARKCAGLLKQQAPLQAHVWAVCLHMLSCLEDSEEFVRLRRRAQSVVGRQFAPLQPP